MTDVSDALAEGETIRERLPLRTGGSVALTDDHLFVVTDETSGSNADGDVVSVALDDVAEVTVEEFDWFLGILSAVLVGYGLYSIPQSAVLGLAFAAFGVASLYWTYRKRGKTRIKVVDRPKPISVFPADTGSFYDALEPLLVADESRTSDGGD